MPRKHADFKTWTETRKEKRGKFHLEVADSCVCREKVNRDLGNHLTSENRTMALVLQELAIITALLRTDLHISSQTETLFLKQPLFVTF